MWEGEMKWLMTLLIALLMWGVAAAQELFFDFEKTSLGELPEGFAPAQTAGRGKLALWQVVEDGSAPKGHKVLFVLPDPRTNHGSCFNVLLYQGQQFKDLDLSVYVKAVKGREDQGGGPLWRAQDENNYYVVRWNPLENNFRLYFVKKGRRKMLASAKLKVDPQKWHLIRVLHHGEEIQCLFDGKELLRVRDHTFVAQGKVGLWSKADAATVFDGLRVKSLAH